MENFPVAAKIWEKKQRIAELFDKINFLEDAITTLNEVAEPIAVLTTFGYYGQPEGRAMSGTLADILFHVGIMGWTVEEQTVRWVISPTEKEKAEYMGKEYDSHPYVGAIHVRCIGSPHYDNALKHLMEEE